MAGQSTITKGVLSAGGILDRIIAKRVERVEETKRQAPLQELVKTCEQQQPDHRSFREAISRKDTINIIAEVKRQSPSKGIIREDFNHLDIARQFAEAGAAAMSVLTEENFFGGHLRFLQEIHALTEVPLLRKDFIIDEYQIYEARLAGASAILLITAVLDDELLGKLIRRVQDLELDALVEVHTEAEMRRAVDAGAQIIGVNNRDLTTFKVDLQTSIRLACLAPTDAILVSESGITTPEDIQKLKVAGFGAFLIGEHLMRQNDIGAELRQLIGV